ncbi:MAG: glycosyltransferase [Elusimicrobiota bacterium]|nr:glycosyltransferase [Elusimicrobiota bacterium]
MSQGISVIVAAYNRAELFRLCLEALAGQAFSDFELIIADDGSGPEIKKIADSFRGRMNIKHVWQEDDGFRKTLAINKAVKISSGDKLYFFDADTIAHPDYISRSKEYICEGQYMVTRAVLLSEKIAAYILENGFSAKDIFSGAVKWKIRKDGFFARTRYCTYGFLLPRLLAAITQSFKKNSNMSGRCWGVHRKDYERVNGYNNDFRGAYCEDSELDTRLANAGIKRRLATNEAVSLHFPHGKSAYSGDNAARLEEVLRSGALICANGLDQIRTEDITVLK